VRDLYTPEAGARTMSKGLTGLGFIACLCAPTGGLLTDTFGWRHALSALTVFGAAAFLLVALRFEETVPSKNANALAPRALVDTWLSIVRHPTFLTWSALSTASYAGLFTFLASSSFIFIRVLGLGRTQYGLVMFSMAVIYIAGTFWCRRLLPRHGVRRSVAIASALTLTAGALMGALYLAGVRSAWALAVPFCLFMFAHGVHQPCGQSGAVAPFPHAAGAASALNGFIMMIAAFAVGGWVGAHLDGTAFALVAGLGFWSACIAVVGWTLVQRYGDPRRA
jgi:DHA1 family bicyclomycin/chloramphenicol resistance-like MFS transporter